MLSRERWRWLLRGILVLIALGAVIAFFLSGAAHHLDFARGRLGDARDRR